MNTDIAPVEALLDSINQAWRTRDVELLRRATTTDEDAVFIGTDSSEMIVGGTTFVQVASEQIAAVEGLDMRVRQRWIQRRGNVAWFTALLDLHLHLDGQTAEIPGVRHTGVAELRDGHWTIVQGHMSVGVSAPPP
jgi:ketosteroid isomerase-like protein